MSEITLNYRFSKQKSMLLMKVTFPADYASDPFNIRILETSLPSHLYEPYQH